MKWLFFDGINKKADNNSMTEKIVNARNIEGWNIPIWNNIFGAKIDFDCGECGFSQSTRIPLKDYPVIECKYCRTLNKINVITTTC